MQVYYYHYHHLKDDRSRKLQPYQNTRWCMCTWVTAASNKLPSRTDDQPDLKEEKTSAENAQRGEDTIRFLEPIPAILLGLNGKRERRQDGLF
mmetsp:Transcript_10893/g.21665  ORF Transcript_10893/g.21665 Transcript_10893/m.21665 type:complete len:93 (-) Transcript_10893:271-549(-)